MTRVIACTGSVILVSALWCGCGRKETPAAHAMAQPTAPTAAAGPVQGGPAFTTGRTLADFVDDQTLCFVTVPDLAPIAALLTSSPLHALVKSGEFERGAAALVGAKAWSLLSQEMTRAAQGMLRGRAEAAARPTTDDEGRAQVEWYVLWNGRDDAERTVRVLFDFLVALRERTPELSCGETSVDGIPARTVTFGRLDRRTCYFAARDGEVRLSTDKSFLGTLTPAARPLSASAEFLSARTRVKGDGAGLALVYTHGGRGIWATLERICSANATTHASSEDLGVGAFVTGGIASYRSEGRTREVGYLEWPEAERGAFAPFLKKANVRGALAVVPSDVDFFCVLGIDIPEAWSRAGALLGRAFPETYEELRARCTPFADALGTDLKTLLKSIGPDCIVYKCERESPFPAVVAVSIRNREELAGVFRRLEEGLGQRLLRESVDGIPIYAGPGGAPVYMGLSEQYLVTSPDVDLVRDFIRQRRGRANPLAGHPEVKDFMNYDDLGAMVYVDAAKEYATACRSVMAWIGYGGEGAEDAAGRFNERMRTAPVRGGGLWTLLFLNAEGISCEIRSDCGFLPLAFGTVVLGAAVALPAAVQASRDRDEKRVLAAINSIMAAQEEFRIRQGRYAQSLLELKDAGGIDAELARGACNGYVFKLKSGGEKNWTFDVRPMSGRGRFFYCDETGTVRVEVDKPAHHESPVAKDTGQ